MRSWRRREFDDGPRGDDNARRVDADMPRIALDLLREVEHLARVRVEKVKNLLLNPHKRVSEAAYEAGCQSLSQFNRVFRRIAGESPTVHRERLHGAAAV